MTVELWMIGKTDFNYLKEGIAIYEKRLQHYLKLQLKVFPDVKTGKKANTQLVKEKEGLLLLEKLTPATQLILLDENGKSYDSVGFSKVVERFQVSGTKRLVFIIGGAYGFSDAVYTRANAKISLSKMTFSHQMVRLIFLEQLYRAMTILRNEPYHHT